MRYKFYTTSEKAWQAMMEDIKRAKKSIFLESFILTDDPITHHFFEALKQKAQEGVKVKIIIDRVAHFWFGSVDKESFERVGAEVIYFKRWLGATHRKLLIVDENVGYIGGVNIRGDYARWLDLHVRLSGRLAKRFLRSFARMYALAGGQDAEVLGLQKRRLGKARAALHKTKVWLVEQWPFRGRAALKGYYKRKCAEAQKSITIMTPHFVPHRWLIEALKQAARRGVRIEVIVPEKTDVWIIDLAQRVFVKNLKSFINFLFIPEMNHAKVLLIDDREGLVGSNNIDAQSFDFNLEASIVFQRKDMVGNLKHILERWKKTAVPLEQVNVYNKWYHRFIGFFVRLLQPIL